MLLRKENLMLCGCGRMAYLPSLPPTERGSLTVYRYYCANCVRRIEHSWWRLTLTGLAGWLLAVCAKQPRS